jgi:integrase
MPKDDDRCILHRRGRLELSKYWPDGSRFRRPFPNKTAAKQMRARIEAAIAFGNWRELKQELSREKPQAELTIQEFSEIYLQHCRTKNARPDFHEEEIGRFLPEIGSVPIKQFQRKDAVRLQAWRSRQSVSPATVNRMMKVLSSMLSYALERGDVDLHPMLKFCHYPEEERALRVMTIEEERAFVAALLKIDLAVFAYAAVMGECALRVSEAERLEWSHLDFSNRLLTVDRAKGKRARYIPLSDFAIDVLRMITRVEGDPHVFIRLETLKPVQEVRGPFAKAQKVTGLDWVHPEDFRHFRATQWVKLGVDLVTVQGLLGHKDIQTTRRYAHFAPRHANRSIVEAQRSEAESLRQLVLGFDRTGPKQDQEVSELERLYAMETAKA